MVAVNTESKVIELFCMAAEFALLIFNSAIILIQRSSFSLDAAGASVAEIIIF